MYAYAGMYGIFSAFEATHQQSRQSSIMAWACGPVHYSHAHKVFAAAFALLWNRVGHVSIGSQSCSVCMILWACVEEVEGFSCTKVSKRLVA
jgi:hypothetical protein